MIPAHIFREYDIRGVAERDMPSPLIEDLGRALGTFLVRDGRRRIALGRDCRLSSPRLWEALRKGLLETGLTLIDIGVGPTPMMYFTVFDLDLDGGVQITGSHNPPRENGFKMMLGKGSLFGDDIQTLRRMIEERDFARHGGGKVEEHDPLPAYVGFVRGNVKLARKDLRVAIDAGNGAGGPMALAAVRAAGIEPVALLCEMDGAFPVHHPDPSQPQNLELLRKTVLEQHLDFGIAYDGDGDRIGLVDGRGETIWGDKLMVLFSRAILARHPGAAVISEVKCSQTMYDDIEAHGGRAIMWRTGHSLIKKKMREEHAALAGEMSGHMFFADRFFGFDDAVYATLRLLEIAAESDRPIHEMLADVPLTFATPELRVHCADEAKFQLVEQVLSHYRRTHDVIDVDGARIKFDGGWGLVRASNTQPVLVLRFEAASEARLAQIRSEVEAVVSSLNGAPLQDAAH
jgi:phosphomannomutase/phosphoglucomutase